MSRLSSEALILQDTELNTLGRKGNIFAYLRQIDVHHVRHAAYVQPAARHIRRHLQQHTKGPFAFGHVTVPDWLVPGYHK